MVTTYGDIARLLHTSPRSVGQVLHNNPDPKQIPCHRVVFADGSLSSSFAFGGSVKQKILLESEGVSFVQNKVDLSKHFYRLK